jgi:hypothetical protein
LADPLRRLLKRSGNCGLVSGACTCMLQSVTVIVSREVEHDCISKRAI